MVEDVVGQGGCYVNGGSLQLMGLGLVSHGYQRRIVRLWLLILA